MATVPLLHSSLGTIQRCYFHRNESYFECMLARGWEGEEIRILKNGGERCVMMEGVADINGSEIRTLKNGGGWCFMMDSVAGICWYGKKMPKR